MSKTKLPGGYERKAQERNREHISLKKKKEAEEAIKRRKRRARQRSKTIVEET